MYVYNLLYTLLYLSFPYKIFVRRERYLNLPRTAFTACIHALSHFLVAILFARLQAIEISDELTGQPHDLENLIVQEFLGLNLGYCSSLCPLSPFRCLEFL